MLFSDLSQDDLRREFVKPYERGESFFSGSELIDSKAITRIRIINTQRVEALEREEIFRADQEYMDEFNRQSHGVFFMGIGAGYEPEHIAEAGEDVSKQLIKGATGFKRGLQATSLLCLAGWQGSFPQ